jgi:hypothetical protein
MPMGSPMMVAMSRIAIIGHRKIESTAITIERNVCRDEVTATRARRAGKSIPNSQPKKR